MRISARVENSARNHQVVLTTGDTTHAIEIPPRPTGFGSSANGGELLFLALATCYCNDIYREAAKRGMTVERVEVDVHGEFEADGMPARRVTCHARVTAKASKEEIEELMQHTDRVAEIQNTLRVETPVIMSRIEAVTV